MRFNEMTESQLRGKIVSFINELKLSLNLITPESDKEDKFSKYIAKRLIEYYSGSARFTSELDKVYEEIVTNYKKYTPFCYASIRTAIKNINV